jgi:hypothetical protein
MRIQPPANPAKDLAALDALRRAKLGPLYGKFWVAPGVRSPSEFNEQGLWEPLPPKKPAESVRSAREEERLKKASGAEWEVPRRFESIASRSEMAATAAAYRNSEGSTSGKRSTFFTRESLQSLFENCDLRPHHANMIAAMWRAAGKPQGQEILLFAAVDGYRIEARYRSRRAVQYNLRALEAIGVIELAKGANTIRRPATYRLRTDALGKRQTYADAKNARKRPHSISHSSPAPAQEPAAQPTPVTAAAPVREEGHRSSARHLGTRKFQRIREARAELVAKIAELMKGCHGAVRTNDGASLWVDEDSPLYRPPMSRENAFISACMSLQLTEREGRELLKFEEPEERKT